jgi:uncharacterized protein (TIGR03435 family)
MKRISFLTGIALVATCAQAQTSRPAFDVASVRVNTKCDAGGRSGGGSTPGQILLECADLRDLILTAYGIYGNGPNPDSGSFRIQVVGGPAWIDSTRYDITAKPAGSASTAEMYGPMMQSLLEDRFHLKIHKETRQGGIFILTVAKNGPKLTAAKQGTGGKLNMSSSSSLVTLNMPGATIANLCTQLGMRMDREVIDKTNLTGHYDIHLEVSPSDLHPKYVAGRTINDQGQPTTNDMDAGPSISTALQQQLGLKMSTGTGPVPVIVIDRIEPMTDN